MNIGAAVRAMGNFGFSDLRVVDPYEPSFREARSAVGAAKLLATAKEYESVAEAIADCTLVVGTTAARNRELQQPLRPLAEGARMIRRQLTSGRVALLFGSEKRGLSNTDLSYCQWLMRIPTREDLPSMNLGQAVAICLYDLARSTVKTRLRQRNRAANAGELERLTVVLMDLLLTSGYTSADSGDRAGQKLRRMVRRMDFSPEDAETWLGMLRQIQWKLRASESK